MSADASYAVELSAAEEMADSPALKATDEFINSRALEILREWVNDPAMLELIDETDRVKSADIARKDAA